MNTRKGFTLVELLVVIAILAILATVSVVGYTSFIQNANNSAAQQELIQVRDKVIADDIMNKKVTVGETIVLTLEATTEAAAATEALAYFKGLADGLDGTITFGENDVTYEAITEKDADNNDVVVGYTATITKVTYTKDAGSAAWIVKDNEVK